MRVLHTSDWHLGKRLNNIERIDEQRETLFEIARICDEQCVDAVVVAGDIYDTSVPSAAAEALLYEALIRICDGGRRPVVVISGNHDDADRIIAPRPFAAALNIMFVGNLEPLSQNYPALIKARCGGMVISAGGQRANIAALPHPHSLSQFCQQLNIKADFNAPYCDIIGSFISNICSDFADGEINIFTAHLMLADYAVTDERMLGNSVILPMRILPQNASYTALGHIHKPNLANNPINAYYSGSILQYHFGDDTPRGVIIADLNPNAPTVCKRIELKSGKRLVFFECNSIDAALSALEANADKYVQIRYNSDIPITSAQFEALKKHQNYADITIVKKRAASVVSVKSEKSPSEMFSSYYLHKTGKEIDQKLLDLFLSVLNSEQ